MSFVCAFRGRRDGYEVPLALAESDQLECFLTDMYHAGPLKILAALMPERARRKLASREKPGIPVEKVRCLLGTTLAERVLIACGSSPAATFKRFDLAYSREAARIARRTQANLLLHSAHALPAFRERFDHDPVKILFQFHPHASSEGKILQADQQSWAAQGLRFTDHLVRDAAPSQEAEYHDGWKYADHVICASSYTKRTLVDAGADATKIGVIPYGVDIPPLAQEESSRRNDGEFRVLFVGSGIQRKGLHHLLRAWQLAAFRGRARLTLVCRVIEPSLRSMVEETNGAHLRSEVAAEDLARLYREASLLCMPSLVEGFGQVYLEALSEGLPVLGTRNTCLPDIGSEQDGVFIVEAGDVAGLASILVRLEAQLRDSPELHRAARLCASRFTWQEFRGKVVRTLASQVAAKQAGGSQ